MALIDRVRREPGIGWDGRTLRAMLEESERLFAATGCYQGLERLTLQERDPIRYEKLFSRLHGGLVSARETALNISASPILEEIDELSFMLYTPEGDSIALSTGIMVHVHTASEAIKYMIRQGYEDNPGIAPGDIFCNNDSLIGNVHNADVVTLVPIFWEDELVGWAGGVTHEIDIGARTPGSVPVGPIARNEDGLDIPARKIGANDELFRDHVLAGVKGTRTPMYWTLDERARLVGCHMARDAVERVILGEGIATYKRFIRELIEEGRRTFRNRLIELTVPGRYRSAAFSEIPFASATQLPTYARVDTLLHAPTELRITAEGVLEFDCTGASAWGHHSMNCTPASMQGALWVQLTQTLLCTGKVNDGAYLATRCTFPPGTWTNHGNPMCSTGISWWSLIGAFTGVVKSLSRAYQARGFVEEVLSAYPFTANVFQGGGIDHFGRQSATTNFGLSCCGGGAKMVLDGLDHAAAMWNPAGDMGDLEMWERIEPFLYLGQRVKASTAGLGRHRGGSGYETLRLAWKTPFYEMQNIDHGHLHVQSGLWGGYPGGAGYRHNVRDTNFFELVRDFREIPTHDGNPEESLVRALVAGRRDFDQHTVTLPEVMKQGDLYVCVYHGGAGLGDVLERDAKAVEDDLNGGYVVPRIARDMYAVAAEQDAEGRWHVDPAETERYRAEEREARRRKSIPVRAWMAEQRERILSRTDMSETVQRMYAESMKLSPAWAAEYREFWGLPDDFEFPVDTPTVP